MGKGLGGGGGGLRFGRSDSEFELHGPADVVDGVGDEFVVEDVVIHRVADAAADDADGEGEGCDCGDEVLEGQNWRSYFFEILMGSCKGEIWGQGGWEGLHRDR